MTYKDTILANGPILYTTFDEAGSTIADSSTAARTVTPSGNPVKTAGIAGTALIFDGVDDSVSAVGVADSTGSSMTWEVWFKSTQTTGTGHLVRRDGSGAAYLLRLNNGKIEWYGNNSAGAILSPTVKADGQWHHVVGVKNGTALTLYIDGVSVATGTATSAYTGTTNVYLGSSGGTSEFFNGTLDEVALYNTALTGAQIQAHYNARILPDTTTVAPAMTMALSAPDVNVPLGVSPPAMTLNLSMPDPSPVMWYGAIADRDNSGNFGTADYLVLDNAYTTVIKFPDLAVPAGEEIISEVLKIMVKGGPNSGTDFTIHRLTEGFTEEGSGGGASWAYDPYGIPGSVPNGAQDRDWLTFDITPIARDWAAGATNHGLALVYQSGASVGFWSKDAFGTIGPRILVEVGELPIADINAVVSGTMNMTLTPPQHRVGTGTTSIVIGTAEMSLSAPDAIVSITSNTAVQALPMEMSMDFAGGKTINPDFTIAAPFVEMWIFAPDVNQYISVDNVIPVTGTMDFTVDGTADTQINLQTDRTIFVQAMTMSIKTPGGYREGVEDRYRTYVPSTVDADDIWLKLNELAGTVAVDSLSGGLSALEDDATYMGGPLLGDGGYRGRKAATFDGADDYILMGTHYPPGVFAGMDATIEFSIKTTTQNGTVIRGGGNTEGSPGNNFYAGSMDSEVRLVNGELGIYTGSGHNVTYRTGKFVADGEWHHVVISLPSSTALISDTYNISAGRPFFVNVDGETVWTRYSPPLYGRSFLPASFMARAVFTAAVSGDPANVDNYSASEHVAGSLSDIVVRYNYAVSRNTAEKLYYEWSETLLVDAEPIVLSLTTPAPFRAKGNMKRMIALYGLPHYLYADDTVPFTRDGFGTYFSVFAGYYIENEGFSVPVGPGGSGVHINYHSNSIRMVFLPVKPFKLENYMVYPVAVAQTPGSNGGAGSADGMIKADSIDPIERKYLDSRTGLPRFVDLDKDLMEDVTDFDAITAVNYPAVLPWDGPGNTQNDPLQEFRQHGLGLTNNEWQTARDRLRDSILSASYRGVNLWINEPHMAEHLGFIQAWDKHNPGDRFEFFGSGNIDPTGYTNERAFQLDIANTDAALMGVGQRNQWRAAVGVGQFNPTWQANAKRRIVSTEPGLTDIPSWEVTDRVSFVADNQWAPHAQFLAYNAIDRMAGLRIGDEIEMPMREAGSYTWNYPAFNGWSVGVPRQFIVSARPEGIVGKAISKELEFFYGPYARVIDNIYKDNVYTIAAERGSVVRGRPIAGRAFIEFMSPNIDQVKIPVDIRRDTWNGDPNKPVSDWSFDTRRYKEVIIVYLLEKEITRKGAGGDTDSVVKVKTEERYVEIQDKEWDYKPYMSMNARGLHWLAEASDLSAGDSRSFVPAINLKLEGEDVTTSNTRNATISVVGAIGADAELIEPASVDNPAVSVSARPITLTMEMRGLGKVVQPGPIELTLTTPDALVAGAGDRITVYMDSIRNVTLFMKED